MAPLRSWQLHLGKNPGPQDFPEDHQASGWSHPNLRLFHVIPQYEMIEMVGHRCYSEVLSPLTNNYVLSRSTDVARKTSNAQRWSCVCVWGGEETLSYPAFWTEEAASQFMLCPQYLWAVIHRCLNPSKHPTPHQRCNEIGFYPLQSATTYLVL